MTSELPFFSIIIPTYNRPAQLEACLRSLTCLDYPSGRFEVIVVDDGGEHPLESLVALFQKQLHLTLLRQANSGATTGRNTGAAAARGDYFVFTDDDCEFAADWLKTLAVRFQASPGAMVGGSVLNRLSGNIASTTSHLLLKFVLEYYNRASDRPGFLSGNNHAVPAEQFRAVGGFNEIFPPGIGADDRELCDRWSHYGHPVIYAPEVRVYHTCVSTLRGFLRQHFKNGQGAWYFHKLRARRSQRLEVEPLYTFYGKLLTYPFKERCGFKAPLFAFLLIAAQLANAAGFFREKFSHKKDM